MKRTSIVVGALLALLAIWVLLGSGNPQETEANRPIQTRAQEPAPSDDGRPKDRAATPEVPPLELRTSTEEQGSASCAEAERLGIAFARSVVLDEGTCALALRVFTGARVPVLPGFAGFEIPDLGDGHPGARLFNESDNPDWARSMEGRILGESARAIDFPLITLHAVCRSSTCGVLFVYTNDAYHGGSYNYYARQLADALGFSGFHAGSSRTRNGIGFMYAYLGDWNTPRLE